MTNEMRQRAVLRYLARHGYTTCARVAGLLGCGRSTSQKLLQAMVKQGIIAKHLRGRASFYMLTDPIERRRAPAKH